MQEPTIENLDNYCDDNLDNFENVYDLETSSHMRLYSQAAADNCVKKFCQREDVKEQLYGGRGAEGYYQYMRSRVSFDPQTSSERLRIVLIKQADIGRCVDYYCGNDYLCAMNYIRFDGNHELASTKIVV